MNVKKSFIILLAIVMLMILTGCYRVDRYIFPEGFFTYNGEPVQFYDDLWIDEFNVKLDKISEDVYLKSNNINVIKNHQDKSVYSMIITLKYTIEDEAKVYKFEYIGKVPGQNDSYKIILNIDNEKVGITGTLTMTFYFLSAIGSSTDIGSYAGRITVYVTTFEINGVQHNDKFHGFPRDLDVKKYVGV